MQGKGASGHGRGFVTSQARISGLRLWRTRVSLTRHPRAATGGRCSGLDFLGEGSRPKGPNGPREVAIRAIWKSPAARGGLSSGSLAACRARVAGG
jgi:hypothetical protein